ncbi:MAG: polysaccharide biosynthesis protein [Verrucomicrobiota bacterium]
MMLAYFQNKRVLLTGAAGFIGRTLLAELLSLPEGQRPVEVVCLDHDEGAMFNLQRKYADEVRVISMLGDVRDLSRVRSACEQIDVVIHAAGLKHVSLCETSPTDAVSTNILGLQNVIEAAREARVDTVLFTSSDKAVNPTNVMGTSKLMGERLISAANHTQRGRGPVFATCRFSNVIGSDGLVDSHFRRQVIAGGPVTVTDSSIVRFFMGRKEAAVAILKAAGMARGGEVLVPLSRSVRIRELAEAMVRKLAPLHGKEAAAIEISEIGLRPGEKNAEDLVSREEARRTIACEGFYSILPAFSGFYRQIEYQYPGASDEAAIGEAYRAESQEVLTAEQLAEFLQEEGAFSAAAGTDEQTASGTYWPGDTPLAG